MSDIQPKIPRHEEKQEIKTSTEGKTVRENPEMMKMMRLADENTNTFTVFCLSKVSEQRLSILRRDREDFLKPPTERAGMRITMSEIKTLGSIEHWERKD